MGAKKFGRYLKRWPNTVDLGSLSGKIIAIDLANLLHRYNYMEALNGETMMPSNCCHIQGLFDTICILLSFGVKPVFVFDGKPPKFKHQTIEKRKLKKRKEEEKASVETQSNPISVQDDLPNIQKCESDVEKLNERQKISVLDSSSILNVRSDSCSGGNNASFCEEGIEGVVCELHDDSLSSDDHEINSLELLTGSTLINSFGVECGPREKIGGKLTRSQVGHERILISQIQENERKHSQQLDPSMSHLSENDGNPINREQFVDDDVNSCDEKIADSRSSLSTTAKQLDTTISCPDNDQQPKRFSDSQGAPPEILKDGENSSCKKTESSPIQLTQQHASMSKIVEKSKVKAPKVRNISRKAFSDSAELIKLFGLPIVSSPGEAEAQCAMLEKQGLTQGTLTEDSDIFLFGGRTVYTDFLNSKRELRMHLASDFESTHHLDHQSLACLALLCGCDYTKGVIGFEEALELLEQFEGEGFTKLIKFKEWWSQEKDCDKKLKKFKKLRLPPDFPREEIFKEFTEPRATIFQDKFSWEKPQVNKIEHFLRQKTNWYNEDIIDMMEMVRGVIKEKSPEEILPEKFFKSEEYSQDDCNNQMNQHSLLSQNHSNINAKVTGTNLLQPDKSQNELDGSNEKDSQPPIEPRGFMDHSSLSECCKVSNKNSENLPRFRLLRAGPGQWNH